VTWAPNQVFENSCKGQGIKEMSKADCDKAKADMKK